MAAKKKAVAKAPAKKDDKAEQKRSMFEKTVKASGKKDLGKISDLVAKYEALEGERNALLATADELYSQMLEMQRQKLPQAFAEAGVADFTDSGSGAHLELDRYISGTWPKDEPKKKKALAWLKKIKQEELLKATVTSKFSRQDIELARKEYERLLKSGKAVVDLKQDIHYQTLQALFRKRLDEGKDVPFDIFDGETGTFVRIDFPKQAEEADVKRKK